MWNPAEASDYCQWTCSWVPFDPWADAVLSSEGARISRLKSSPVYGNGSGGWGTPSADICYLNVRSGDRFSWLVVPAAIPQSDHPSLFKDTVFTVGELPPSLCFDQQLQACGSRGLCTWRICRFIPQPYCTKSFDFFNFRSYCRDTHT